jgi:HYDIN/CFA65/VesB family protein/ASPM-SPD-2-Hydin domain-containing protein/centrosomal CEP192-like protein
MDKTRLVCLFIGIFVTGFILFPAPAHAGVGVTPSAVSFGSIAVGSTSTAATVTITNNSRQTVSIQQVSSSLSEFVVITPVMPMTLGPRSSISVQVVFRPDSAATFNGSVVITSGRKGGSPISIAVTGSGIAAASTQTYLLSTNATSLNFGNTLVGSSASQTITVTNTGTGSVTISQVVAAGAGFKVTGFSGSVTLAAGQSLPLAASFSPAATGSVAGSISVVSNATNSPATITLSGTGVQPQITLIPSSISFGSVAVGVTNTQTLTLRNPGTATLNVTQASLSGTGFSTSGLALPLSVAPGGSASFTVGFAPVSASNFQGSITLISNTPNSPLVVPLSGAGISTVLQLSASPASLAFGNLATGTTATQSVTISNTGNSGVSISQVIISGAGFTTTGIALPLSLAAGQSTSFSVTFAPVSTGNLAGSVSVVSNAANSPSVITLSGTGILPVSYTVSLNWTPSSSIYSGFNVYRGTIPGGPYSRVDSSLVSSTSYTDPSVTPGQTYYYVATQVDSSGMESGYSSEVSATIP